MIKIGYARLFSIRIQHDYIDGPFADIAVTPTPDCQKILAKHGLIFKQLIDGGIILFSLNDTNEIQQKINALVSFRFLLSVQNQAFENFTNLPYPAIKLGKKVFYFSNINNNGGIDSTTTLAKSTDNKLGDLDYSWLSDSMLSIPLAGNFSRVDLSKIVPGIGKQLINSFETTGLQNLVIDFTKIPVSPTEFLRVEPGNYILDFVGNTPKTERIYVDSSLLKTNCWGVVEIVKDNTIDYSAQPDYTLTAKANPWSFYLLDPANKVTITNNALANLSTTTTGLSGLSLSWVQEADLGANTYEQRRYAVIKQQNADKRLFLLRSNRSMPKSAESTVAVKLTLDGVQRTLSNPIGSQSKSDSIQTL